MEDHCVSACTFIFLAGAKRELADDAELGFHQATVVGVSTLVQTILNDQMFEYYRAQGLHGPFIDRIIATPLRRPAENQNAQTLINKIPGLTPGVGPHEESGGERRPDERSNTRRRTRRSDPQSTVIVGVFVSVRLDALG